MYELIQALGNSYYMDCPAKVGIVVTNPGEAVLIDAGSDKDAGKKVKKLLDANGWRLQAVFNTHSHADHIGGNQYLQQQTGCPVYAPGTERAVALSPILEPAILYGAHPMKELQNKFLMAKEAEVQRLTGDVLPEGWEMIPLSGHSFEMTGFRTKDDVVYLADCVSSAETLEKYGIGYLYDVKAHLDTLERVKGMEAKCFVPAHAPQTVDIVPLAQKNMDAVSGILYPTEEQ